MYDVEFNKGKKNTGTSNTELVISTPMKSFAGEIPRYLVAIASEDGL